MPCLLSAAATTEFTVPGLAADIMHQVTMTTASPTAQEPKPFLHRGAKSEKAQPEDLENSYRNLVQLNLVLLKEMAAALPFLAAPGLSGRTA